MRTQQIVKKTGKVILYILLTVLVLLIGVFIFLNTSAGKKTVRNQVQSFLQKRLQTKVVIGTVDYSLPKWLELGSVYIEDLKKDTFLYGERLSVDLDMLKLLSGDIYIRKVELKNIRGFINRTSTDSLFNYQFIADAFAPKESTGAVRDTAALKLTLKQLILDNVSLRYNDEYGGNEFYARIGSLNATMDKLQPDRYLFNINRLRSDNVEFTMVTTKAMVPTATAQDSIAAGLYPVLVNANDLNFKNVHVSVVDKVTGMEYFNRVHELSAGKLMVDLKKQQASADLIRLDSSQVKFVGGKTTAEPPASYNSNWILSAKSIVLNNDEFQFDDNAFAAKEGLDPAHLAAKGIQLNAEKFFYSPDSTTASVRHMSFKEQSGFSIDTARADILYTTHQIAATNLLIKTPLSTIQNNVSIRFEDLAKITTQMQSSYVEAALVNSTIAINDLYTLVPFIKQYLPVNQFRNQIIRVNTQLSGSLQRLNVPYLQMAGLSGSVINARATLYNVADPKRIAYDVTVLNSSVSKVDLAKFLPADRAEMLSSLPGVINISTKLKGDLNNTSATIDLKSKSIQLTGTAAIKNISDPTRLRYDIAITKSRIGKTFITSFIDEKELPPNIRLPELIVATGTLTGDMNNVRTNLKLGGSFGNAAANGFVHNFKDAERATYDLQLDADQFSLGKLIKQDSMIGAASFSMLAKGKGYNYKTMQGSIRGNISNVDFNKYNYKNILINADLDKGNIQTNGSINDSSLQMQYDLAINVNAAYPTVEGTVNIDTVQLKNLHLYKDTLNLAMRAFVKAKNLQPRNLDLYALIDSGKVFFRNKTYPLDSIIAKATTINGTNNIILQSPFIDATATGAFDYDKVGNSLLKYINRYYKVTDSLHRDNGAQQIAMSGVVKKNPLIMDLVPGLMYENIDFKGNYTSSYGDSALKISAHTPLLVYQTNSMRNAKVDINALNAQLQYLASFDTLDMGTRMMYATTFRGNIANDSIAIIATANDEKNITRYIAGGTFMSKGKDFSLSLSDSLILNYKKWTVAPHNNIRYSPQGILVTDFVLSNDSARISAVSQQPIPNSPIDITIQNFSIRDLTEALNNDTLLAEGLVNAKVNISEFNKNVPAFTGDITVQKLKVMQSPVGNIHLSAQKQNENTINASLDLSENGNKVNVAGHYYLNDERQQFDAVVDVKQLQLATLQGFTKGNMSRASGHLFGMLQLKGKFNNPEYKGTLNFDTARFTITQFGTTYSINKDQVIFDYPTISFKEFTILDSLGHPFIIDGTIRSRSLMEYDLAVDMNSRDFTLVNAPKAIANQVYGFAAIDANISVSGTSTAPNIEGDVYIAEKSDVTMILPQRSTDKETAISVVRFIDRDTFALPEKTTLRPTAPEKINFARFLNYNLNIQVDKGAALTIVIDPSTGDELKVQGDARLNAGVDPGGNIVLAGSYELNSGYYVLNYQFLKRRFNLMQGSTIYFAGNPLQAQINITAEYIANTSPKELLGNEVGTVDPRFANTFNQKVPFRVILNLKGSLQKPDISFDILLPEEGLISNQLRTTIDNKLVQLRADVAATNKQVFALLALGRFVGEQSTDFFKSSGSGGGFNDIARESVSKFLSAALDQIASDLFKGINVDLNLNSYKDFTTSDGSQKTDLNVEVSKNFLNDRLIVTVGKNFGIEGQDASAKAAQQKGSRFLPDVTVNYKLSKDGKYMIRAYNKNQFEVILDGYVVETGLAFIVTMDYDEFKELFIRKNKKEDR